MGFTLRFFAFTFVFLCLNKVFGANIVDDTKFFQSLIDKALPGDTVSFPAGTHYVHSLVLREGIHIQSKGLLKQLPTDSTEEYSLAHQRSNAPLFYGKGVSNISLSFRAKTNNEALILENCRNISLHKAVMKGDSTKFRSFAGVYIYKSEDINIEQADIAYYGCPRAHVSSYQPGTGVRVQSSRQIGIEGCNIHHNGQNGIFFHASRDIVVHHNKISHNGMSGIQVAFGSAQVEKNYNIIGNELHHNAADAIDINNPNAAAPIALEAVIQDNISTNNGWVKGKRTRDGSGIATLVGLKDVLVKYNKSRNSNRPAVYVRGCDQIDIVGNEADNVAEIVGELGTIHLYKNTIPGVRLLASVKAKKLKLDSNNIRHLSFPNGISVDSLVLLANDLKGNINVNMEGKLIFKGNKLSSTSDKGGISLWKVNAATLRNNEIHTTVSQALTVMPDAENVLIQQNKMLSAKTCIRDGGSHKLKIIQNRLASKHKGENLETVISTNPRELYFEDNEYYIGGEKKEHATKLEGKGTIFREGECIQI